MTSMYKVLIGVSPREKVDNYTIMVRDYYVDLYTDTGLGYAEAIILSQYREAAHTLNYSILENISDICARETIHYTPLESGLRETSFRMGNRRIFLTYEEDPSTLTRYITDIEILRK